MSAGTLFQFESAGRKYVLEGALKDLVPIPVQGIAGADRVGDSLVLTFFSETSLSSSDGVRAYPSVTISIQSKDLGNLCKQLNLACFTLFPDSAAGGDPVEEKAGIVENLPDTQNPPLDLSDPF